MKRNGTRRRRNRTERGLTGTPKIYSGGGDGGPETSTLRNPRRCGEAREIHETALTAGGTLRLVRSAAKRVPSSFIPTTMRSGPDGLPRGGLSVALPYARVRLRAIHSA
jgi:hypothetical protein